MITKEQAIEDAKQKRLIFPDIGQMYIIFTDKRGYLSVSAKYYKDNLFIIDDEGESHDFMKKYKIIETV